jgi:hypothetical protein
MASSIKAYQPALDFIETLLGTGSQFFSSVIFIKQDFFMRELQIFEAHLQKDLANHPLQLQQALTILKAIEGMNKPHFLLKKKVKIDLHRLTRHVDEIQKCMPIETLSDLA